MDASTIVVVDTAHHDAKDGIHGDAAESIVVNIHCRALVLCVYEVTPDDHGGGAEQPDYD